MTEALVAPYEALPFTPTPERAAIFSYIVRSIAAHESLFTDYQRACVDRCYATQELHAMCGACRTRVQRINALLGHPKARVWEVWGESEYPVGILYLTEIIPGGDALAHYVFFDGNLRDKTALVEQMIEWCFTDHDDWRALRRLTIEVPAHAFALARHASRSLGFGGPFTYRRKFGDRAITVPVEGIKRAALMWHNEPQDMLILGRLA